MATIVFALESHPKIGLSWIVRKPRGGEPYGGDGPLVRVPVVGAGDWAGSWLVGRLPLDESLRSAVKAGLSSEAVWWWQARLDWDRLEVVGDDCPPEGIERPWTGRVEW